MNAPLYTATYETGNSTEVLYVEYPVSLPDMPPLEDMHNYGFSLDEQVFRRMDIPDEFRTRSSAKRVPWQRTKRFVDEMWHKRRNGEWWLIKGEPVYITGTAWLYFNFWHYAVNTYCDFAMQCVWWYQVVRDMERNPKMYGTMDIKPRRSFSTEMSLCWEWDTVTKYRDSNGGIISKGDDDAQKAFDRMTFANENMIWFFKPKHSGKARPLRTLLFRYPSRGMTVDGKDFEDSRIPAINSKVWYEPTVEGKFDGEKLRAALFDEIGKIPVTKMNVFKQWKIMRECMSLYAGALVVGKCILPSTIEDLDDGRSIQVVKKFWDNSDPNNLGKTRRTISGCTRMFRPFWIAGKTDKWGFPDPDEARALRNAEIDAMEAEGLHDEVTDYKRKYPETIEEALAMPATETILPIPLIDKALERCRAMREKDMSNPLRPVRGSFVWANRFGGDVKWLPDPNGRWDVSRHPDEPNKHIIVGGRYRAPGNVALFGMGVDPIDLAKPTEGGSKGACTVASVQDWVRDSHCTFDENDILLTGEMWSDACCCDYLYRPELPEEFFEDMIMTAIYYGSQMLVEYNKPGIITWGYEHGFGAYFAQKPITADAKFSRGAIRKSRQVGVYAGVDTIEAWYTHTRSHLIRRYRNYTHERLLNDLRQLTDKNRGERDLSVAWGWTRTLISGLVLRTKRERHGRAHENANYRRGVLHLYPTSVHQ